MHGTGALERTGFWIPELFIVLDAGFDLPTSGFKGRYPAAIFVTHGHIDHIKRLPMLLRKVADGAAVHIFAPAPILHRLRQFCQLLWAVKVDDGAELSAAYAPTQNDDREICQRAVHSAPDAVLTSATNNVACISS